ncbi:MAG: peroxide stress protein YaaA [Patescibacteria group bacterium]
MPSHIIATATNKDLKCIDKRFEQAKSLNANILANPTLPAIERYDGVMYRAIGANSFDKRAAKFFDEHVLILSGLFGLVKASDQIPNYKLPIEAHGLVTFWKEKITRELAAMEDVIFIDLLPLSYRKMIDWHVIPHYLTVEFVDVANDRIGHGVKGIK